MGNLTSAADSSRDSEDPESGWQHDQWLADKLILSLSIYLRTRRLLRGENMFLSTTASVLHSRIALKSGLEITDPPPTGMSSVELSELRRL